MGRRDRGGRDRQVAATWEAEDGRRRPTFGHGRRHAESGRAPAPGTKSRARSELGSNATTVASRSAPLSCTVVVVLPATTCAFVTACWRPTKKPADRQQSAAPGARDLCRAMATPTLRGRPPASRPEGRRGRRAAAPAREEPREVGGQADPDRPPTASVEEALPMNSDGRTDAPPGRRTVKARRQQAADQPNQEDDVRRADDRAAGHVERPQRLERIPRLSVAPIAAPEASPARTRAPTPSSVIKARVGCSTCASGS